MIFIIVTFVSLLVVGAALLKWASSGTLKEERLLRITKVESRLRQSSEPFSPSKTSLKLVTYNIGYASGQANNRYLLKSEQTQQNLDQIRSFLEERQFDFALLQEVDFGCRRSAGIVQDVFLAGSHFPIVVSGVSWDKNFVPFPMKSPSQFFGRILSGQATLSRYNVNDSERHVFEKPRENFLLWNAFYLDRVALVTEVQIEETRLLLVNIHLEAFVEASRERQAKVLRSLLEKWNSLPMIVAGDFNAEMESETLRLLTADGFLRRVAQTPGPTFPSWKPDTSLDHILVNSKVDLEKYEVVEVPGQPSDHLPVIAEFKIRNHA